MEYVEVYYDKYLKETNEAVLLRFDYKTKWVPKSCITDGFEIDYNSTLYIELERWFAEKERLV